jgi:hypothetical protein
VLKEMFGPERDDVTAILAMTSFVVICALYQILSK